MCRVSRTLGRVYAPPRLSLSVRMIVSAKGGERTYPGNREEMFACQSDHEVVSVSRFLSNESAVLETMWCLLSDRIRDKPYQGDIG